MTQAGLLVRNLRQRTGQGPCFPMLFLTVLVLVALIMSGLASSRAQAQSSSRSTQNVLILHGLWFQGRWQSDLNRELEERFLKSSDLNIDMAVEFLGLEGSDSQELTDRTLAHLQHKLTRRPVDVVVAALPIANNFLLQHGDRLFKGVPKVFLLPGEEHTGAIRRRPDAVLIPSAVDYRGNVEQIYWMRPLTREIIVAAGGGKNDLAYVTRAKAALSQADGITYWVGLPRG